jgi:hypothetical protein
MEDPSQNWKDGSVRALVNSVGSPSIDNKEYVFNTADLEQLDIYTDEMFDYLIPFPATVVFTYPDGDTSALNHSAVVSRFEPTASDPAYSYAIYWSKMGDLGVFEHRWGPKYTPNMLTWNTDLGLSIFVPNGNGWGGQPPWLVYWPDPFGPN